MPETPDEQSELSERERARERRRDRKRETRMVVDNAAVRRVLPALQRRRRSTNQIEPRPDGGRETDRR